MSLKTIKNIQYVLVVLILIALNVLAWTSIDFNKAVVLPEEEFVQGQYVFSKNETLFSFWKENIGDDNCCWEKYSNAVSDLNPGKSLGDIRPGQKINVYYVIEGN